MASSRITSVADLNTQGLYDPESPIDATPPRQPPLPNLQTRTYGAPGPDAVDFSHVQLSPSSGDVVGQQSRVDTQSGEVVAQQSQTSTSSREVVAQQSSHHTAKTRLSESHRKGWSPASPSSFSGRSRFSWHQTDRYEPLSPVGGPPRASTGFSSRLRSIRSTTSGRLSRHAIAEGEEIDMGLMGHAGVFGLGGTSYHTIEDEEAEDELAPLGVDISSYTGPESPQDAATVKKYRQLELNGHLTGGLGSGLKPELTLRSTDLYASATPTSPLEVSRRLSRNGSVLRRTSTLRDLGQREANKRGKIIEVVVEDGVEESASVDLSSFSGDHTPPVEFDPSQNRKPTIKAPQVITYYPQPNWKPHSMRWPYLTALTAISITLAVAQEILYRKSSALANQTPPSGLFEFTSPQELSTWDYFSFKYLPTMIAVAYGILWQITDYEVKRLEPFHRLARKGGALAAESINVDYITIISIFRPFRALRYKHYAVAVSSVATFLAVSLVPTLQSASIALQPDRNTRFQDPHGLKFININPIWSRVLTVILGTISLFGFILLCQLHFRRSGLSGDVKGIAGIAAMATKSHVLMDFKDLDTVPPQDIHNKLKNHRYTLRHSSLTSEDAVPVSREDKDKYDRYRLSANPHPLMLRLEAGIPFIVSTILFLIFLPIVIFTPANVVLDKALWLLTALAVAIKVAFQALEQDVRLMEPFYRLSCRHAPPRVLTLDYTTMAFGFLPVRAALNRDYLMAFVGLGTVFAEILTVCVTSFAGVSTGFLEDAADSTAGSTETPKSFWVSFNLSIFILLYLIVVSSCVYKLRRHPFLPRQPSTIASVLAFIHQSKMLYDFVAIPAERPTVTPQTSSSSSSIPTINTTNIPPPDPADPDAPQSATPTPGIRPSAPLRAPASHADQSLLVKRLAAMGKTYGLGWFTGRDGETHCGVDQEELRGSYRHRPGEDVRKATKPWLGNWEYL